MHEYGAREVEKLLQLPRSTIDALVRAGFVTPTRGARNSLRFTFQDVIVLRTAQSLVRAQIAPKRITAALKALRAQLPESMPLSGLAIGAVGDQVVVREGSAQRRADSGQYLLSFEGDLQAGGPSVVEPIATRAARSPAAAPGESAQDLIERAEALEADDPAEAIRSFELAIALDPTRRDAPVNLGRLLHESGRLDEAVQVYRQALEAGGDDALLQFNLGVALEDQQQFEAAVAAYEAALRDDPTLADACYNLSLLHRRLDRPQQAIRYMSQYRRLLRSQAE